MQSISLLLKVLWSPGEALFLLSKNPKVLVPIVFLSVFSMMTGVAVMTKISPADLAIRAIEKSPQGANFSDDQKEQLRQRMNLPIVKALSFTTTVLAPACVVLIVAALYFGVFTVLGREGSFKAFFSITAFAFIPTILRQLAAALSVFVVPAASIMPDELGSLSPAVFLDRDALSPVLFAGINMIDLVSIWVLALLVIGYGYLTRKSLSKMTRTGAVIGVFLVYAFFRLLLARVQGG